MGFILTNFTAILLSQDRHSTPAKSFMVEHFFYERLFPSQLLLYIHTPTLFV